MTYILPSHINPNKIFIINRSELEGKLEPEFYTPEIIRIENSIRRKTIKKLKDFISKIASGATPSVQEEEKYYSDSESGYPFLRVQNLQTNGRVNLSDVKFINKETHENYLKRSQVNEGDLLVKITGVGRMAIASVAPENFIGNTNQHLVVIKTMNKEGSEYLANYLNLDIVEKLASRRATGGTRPALDYPALKSIPIIENIDFSILEKAEKIKQQKEAEAKLLLQSIDVYLLNELGITLPEKDNSLQSRIFTASFSDVTGGRMDGYYYQNEFLEFFEGLKKSKFPIYTLREISKKITSGITPLSGGDAYTNKNEGIPFIRSGDIDVNGSLKFEDLIYIKKGVHNTSMKSSQLKFNDLMIAIVGATIGQVGIFKNDIEANINQAIALVRLDDNFNPDFIKEVVKSSIGQYNLNRLKRPVARANINLEEISTMRIVIPPLAKQNEIAAHIQQTRNRAKQLQTEAAAILENANSEIEKMILQ